ncbi:hypothetical protein [Inconstantimicrobium porci]|uniref:Uncharacterized protein n=1 Tax=Inconstantimicrobium porci TaxID=2652291 RepID=A0A7X2T1V0_9CLOT|nr:hypothetical protein [Inconstantimicrobium porci]MSR91997.1 hypothetical protein [Inconstantimicrobium porci]
MKCARCGSENVSVQTEMVGGKAKLRKTGCLWSIGRLCLILCTCGLWLLVGKRKGTNNIKYKNRTVCICQNCGNKWYLN